MGVTSLGIHSTVDFILQIPANVLIFVVLLALGWVSLHPGHVRWKNRALTPFFT